MQQLKTKELTTAAIMSAFVFIATFVPKIPIPLGYAHLGDAAIFIVVMIFGRKIGIISASVGSALADLISGFPIWIVPTIFIKWIMAEIFARVAQFNDKKSIYSWKMLVAMVIACLFMTIGYTLSGAVLYDGLAVASTMIPGLLLKSLVNIIATIVIGSAINHSFIRH